MTVVLITSEVDQTLGADLKKCAITWGPRASSIRVAYMAPLY
jgi:hypothetical protein